MMGINMKQEQHLREAHSPIQPLIQFSDVLLSRTRKADTSDLRTTT